MPRLHRSTLTDTHTDRQTRLLALKIKQKAVKTGSCTLGTKSIIGKLGRKEFEKKEKRNRTSNGHTDSMRSNSLAYSQACAPGSFCTNPTPTPENVQLNIIVRDGKFFVVTKYNRGRNRTVQGT